MENINEVNKALDQLKQVKDQLKPLKAQEKKLADKVKTYMVANNCNVISTLEARAQLLETVRESAGYKDRAKKLLPEDLYNQIFFPDKSYTLKVGNPK